MAPAHIRLNNMELGVRRFLDPNTSAERRDAIELIATRWRTDVCSFQAAIFEYVRDSTTRSQDAACPRILRRAAIRSTSVGGDEPVQAS
jgi:hypothetical protein